MYIVAELCEEYPTISGKIIKIALVVVIIIHLILWIDGIPWKESLIGIISHGCYYHLQDKIYSSSTLTRTSTEKH